MDSPNALSRLYYRERHNNNNNNSGFIYAFCKRTANALRVLIMREEKGLRWRLKVERETIVSDVDRK